MNRSITDTVVMVPPESFGYNPETAGSNTFQHTISSTGLSAEEVRSKACNEFNAMRDTLTREGIRVLELPSPKEPCPDAVFPNNWFTHHEDGTLIVYPMLTASRRKERQGETLTKLLRAEGIPVKKYVDLSPWEENGWYLEGTGSISLDRESKTAFAMESARTTKEAFLSWSSKFSYTPVLFHAYDNHHIPVYHTNILLNIGKRFAVLCPDAISNTDERDTVLESLQKRKKEIIEITIEQMGLFCGNILQLKTKQNDYRIILSATAYDAFHPKQRKALEKHGTLVPVPIPTIETIGGGSCRCMMAEVFS